MAAAAAFGSHQQGYAAQEPRRLQRWRQEQQRRLRINDFTLNESFTRSEIESGSGACVRALTIN